MVGHFGDLTYVHLIKITIQEEIFVVKADFERWYTTFEVKIYRYHAENGRFSEQRFRSAIEGSNQTKTNLGVVYHHQNAIVEIIIQTITLGYRTLLIHAKIYCLYSTTTMLCPYAIKTFVEQLDELKVDNDGITPMEKFSGTTTDITL